MSSIPYNWQGWYAKHQTCAKFQDETEVQSESKCFIAFTRQQFRDAFSPSFLNQSKAAFRQLTHTMTEEVPPYTNSVVTPPDESEEKLTSYNGILK